MRTAMWKGASYPVVSSKTDRREVGGPTEVVFAETEWSCLAGPHGNFWVRGDDQYFQHEETTRRCGPSLDAEPGSAEYYGSWDGGIH
jgi:hypothetical protein